MHSVLVSVIMPVYNAEKYVSDAIKSILEQTYTHLELIILNDGSTDNSPSLIRSFDDNRIRFYDSKINTGLVSQLNNGIQHSMGKYIARMDADDIATPNRLKKQVEYLENNPAVGLCGTFVVSFNDRKKYFKSLLPLNHAQICAYLLFGSPFFHPSLMMRKDILELNEIRYTTGTDSTEDYYLYIDLHDKTQFANVPVVGLRYRLHEFNMSKTHGDFQRISGEIKRREYVHKFLASDTGAEAIVQTDFHFNICSKKIGTHKDLVVFLNWVKHLNQVNDKHNNYERHSFLAGCSHFVYRKLIQDNVTNIKNLVFMLTHYPGLFFALPLPYRVLFTLRCFRSIVKHQRTNSNNTI